MVPVVLPHKRLVSKQETKLTVHKRKQLIKLNTILVNLHTMYTLFTGYIESGYCCVQWDCIVPCYITSKKKKKKIT